MKKEIKVKGRRSSDNAEDKIILKIDGFWEYMAYVTKYRTGRFILVLIALFMTLTIGIAIVLNLSFKVNSSGEYQIEWDKAADIKINKGD